MLKLDTGILVQLAIFDQVRNQRYENTSTVGAKLWIESPLEDTIRLLNLLSIRQRESRATLYIGNGFNGYS